MGKTTQQTKDPIGPKSHERGLDLPSFWDPAGWLGEIDHWFDDLRRDFDATLRAPFLTPRTVAARRPLVDVRDVEEEFLVTAELPGVSKENVDITVSPDSVELWAKAVDTREETATNFVLRERRWSEIHRRIALPAEVRPEGAGAALRNGILEVRLPKTTPTTTAKRVKVPVA